MYNHRLAHGRFPDNLNALSPQFISRLPNDPITGKPFLYRRTADDQFVLYCQPAASLKRSVALPMAEIFVRLREEENASLVPSGAHRLSEPGPPL